jgi:hypothetical protein
LLGRRRLTISAGDVLEVLPRERRLLLRAEPSQS